MSTKSTTTTLGMVLKMSAPGIKNPTAKIALGKTHITARVPGSSRFLVAKVPSWVKKSLPIPEERAIMTRLLESVKKRGKLVIETVFGTIYLAHSASHGYVTWGRSQLLTKSPNSLSLIKMMRSLLIAAPSLWVYTS